jgi:hypothetical protein
MHGVLQQSLLSLKYRKQVLTIIKESGGSRNCSEGFR